MQTERGDTQKDLAMGFLRSLGGLAQLKEFTVIGIPSVILRRLLVEGSIVNPARGIYALPEMEADPNLSYAVEALSAPTSACICLLTAAYLQGLIAREPHEVQMFVPRGKWLPRSAGRLPVNPVSWRQFDEHERLAWTDSRVDPTVDLQLSGRTFTATCPSKTVADLFYFRNSVGVETAVEALGSCLARDVTISEIEGFADQLGISSVVMPYLSGAGASLNRKY